MNLKDTISSLPTTPGIYQYFDTDGKLLSVGKAKNLKSRVKSYFKFMYIKTKLDEVVFAQRKSFYENERSEVSVNYVIKS